MTALELINLICPEHNPVFACDEPVQNRTTCDDVNLLNGFYTLKGHPRCTRCALLQLLAGEPMPEGFKAFPTGIEFDW